MIECFLVSVLVSVIISSCMLGMAYRKGFREGLDWSLKRVKETFGKPEIEE